VQLEFVLNDGRADLIAEGIDLAFRGGVLPDSSLVARKLVQSHMALIASPRYWSGKGAQALADLVGHACLPPWRQHTVWKLEGPHGPENVQVVPRLCINTAQGQLRAARAGLGIALLPTMLASEDLRNGSLVVLPDYQRDTMGFYAVYVHRANCPARSGALIEFFADKLGAALPTKARRLARSNWNARLLRFP
jgi:DNA-binding transcriptional LysR family regulator